MRLSPIKVILILIVVLAAPNSAITANKKAQLTVTKMEQDESSFLVQFPALELIFRYIRSDCAVKNDQKMMEGDFCKCASAVTLSLWRSGIDPRMVQRLDDFMKSPTEDGAKAFVRFQGPELYRDVCMEAGKH